MNPHALLIPPRRSGFSPLQFGADLALWLDPSYGVYTDRSTQLTAASRFIIIDRNSRMVSIAPLTLIEHAKDLAEAMSAAHDRRKAREAGGS